MAEEHHPAMLAKRVLVTIVLLPIGLVLIWLGGCPTTCLIALILGLAAWEYASCFALAGCSPPAFWSLAGAAAAGGRPRPGRLRKRPLDAQPARPGSA